MDTKWIRNSFIGLLVLVGIISALFTIFPPAEPQVTPSPISEETMIRLAKAGLVYRITVGSGRLTVERTDRDGKFIVRTDEKTDVYQLLEDGGVEPRKIDEIKIVEPRQQSGDWTSLIINLAPLVVFLGLLVVVTRLRRTNRQIERATSTDGSLLPEGIDASSIYHVLPEGFPAAYRRGLWRTSLFIGLTMLVFAIALIKNTSMAEGSLTWEIVLVPVVALAFFVFLFVMLLRKGNTKARQIWLSYELFVGDDVVKRRQRQMPDVDMRADEVTSIEEEVGRGILIRTRDSGVSIHIPDCLDLYQDAKKRLSRWRPVEPSNRITRMERLSLFLGIAWIAALGVALIVDNLIMASAAALFFTALLVRDIIVSRRSRNVNLSIKANTPVAVILLVPIIAKLAFLIMPFFGS